jgi:biotin carboxyl carrier protein
MALTYDDVHNLMRVLNVDHCDGMTLEINGLKIGVEWCSTPAAAAEATQLAPAPAPEPQAEVRSHRVKAAAVGRLVWEAGSRPSVGLRVEPATVLARIEADKQVTPVTAGAAGRVAFVRNFEDGDLVAYGQWLLVVEPV